MEWRKRKGKINTNAQMIVINMVERPDRHKCPTVYRIFHGSWVLILCYLWNPKVCRIGHETWLYLIRKYEIDRSHHCFSRFSFWFLLVLFSISFRERYPYWWRDIHHWDVFGFCHSLLSQLEPVLYYDNNRCNRYFKDIQKTKKWYFVRRWWRNRKFRLLNDLLSQSSQ